MKLGVCFSSGAMLTAFMDQRGCSAFARVCNIDRYTWIYGSYDYLHGERRVRNEKRENGCIKYELAIFAIGLMTKYKSKHYILWKNNDGDGNNDDVDYAMKIMMIITMAVIVRTVIMIVIKIV